MCAVGYAQRGKGKVKWLTFSLFTLRDEEGEYVIDAAVDSMVWPRVEHEVFCRAIGVENYWYAGRPLVDIRAREEHWVHETIPPVDHEYRIARGYVNLLRLAAHRSVTTGNIWVEKGCLLTSERYVCAMFGWDANELEMFVREGITIGAFEVSPVEGLPKGALCFYFHGYDCGETGEVEEWEKLHSWGVVGATWGRHISPRKRARRIPAVVRERVLARAGGKCEWCGSTDSLEIDHIHPVARGGSAAESNLQVLCSACNAYKTDKVFASPPSAPICV
jgi:hypothetical protein